MPSPAHIMIENARVLTMDTRRLYADALAIAGNRIVGVGRIGDLARLKTAQTRVIDAGGASVLPGFIESHMHIFPGSVQIDRPSLANVAGLDAAATLVRAHAATSQDELILVEQAHYHVFGADRPITRHILDQILPDRPLAFYAPDHHTMWANTPALKAAGLLNGASLPAGSEVVMGGDGLATGELREYEAYQSVFMMTPTRGRESNGLATGRVMATQPTPAERKSDLAVLRRGLAYCASLGITSFHNMDGDPYQLDLLHQIEQAEGLSVRAYVPFRMLPGYPLSDYAQAVAERERYNTAHLRTGFVKMFIDGVIESTTAFMLDDYGGAPGKHGSPLFSRDEFFALCAEADRLGFQIAVHAIGDAAVRWTLDAYEEARRRNGMRDARHRIEHIEALDPADLPRLAALGVLASVQPIHAPGAIFPMEPICSLLGHKRLETAYATQSLRMSGARLTFASDWPVAPLNPLLGIKAAMTRQPLYDGAPDQSQSLADALAGYTRDGAHAEFAETEKGMLREGMLADLVMLSGDIESVPAKAIDELKAALTICDGRITFDAASG